MVTQTAYGLMKKLDLPYDEALERVKEALESEGFGVLTEIDVKDTLKQKLQVDFRRYQIIGACFHRWYRVAVALECEGGE